MLSLLERAKVALDNKTPISLPVSDIRRYEDQPRKHFDPEKIRQLSVSIDQSGQAVSGIIHAVSGSTPFQLIDGERRWRAIQLIPVERQPLYKADIIEADEDVIRFLVAGMTNLNRVGHSPLEMAHAIDRYLGFNMKMPEIASVLGISEVWGQQIHGLTKLTEEVAAMLSPDLPRNEQLPVTAAIQIAKTEPFLQIRIANQILTGKISLAGVRKAVIDSSARAGISVRTREVEPKKQWASLKNRLAQARRVLEDARTRAESAGVTKYLDEIPIDQENFVLQIKAVEEMLGHLRKQLG